MPKKLTKDEFVERAKELYGNKYDYKKVNYINNSTRVTVTCKKHGDFLAIPHNFLIGHGCPVCSGREHITQEIFINRSKKVHENRYDYSKVIYKGLSIPVKIICPIHGEFMQQPRYHMNGNGCQKCFATPKSNTEEFIKKAKKIYGDKYDYSKVNYKGNKSKVVIICPKHGEWEVTPNNFLRGSQCPGCYGTPKYTNEEFIDKARIIHRNKYDYSKVVYDGLKKKVKIVCPIHGEFDQLAGSHLRGCGCPTCSSINQITIGYRTNIKRVNRRISKEEFLERSKVKHKIIYDYSKVDFDKSTEKICIVCSKHGEFWQSVSYHMAGGNCPKCVGGVKITVDDFVKKANKIHHNKYNYSKVNYKNTSTKVCIICPEHGEFWQTPNNHLFGAGCPTCPQSNLEGKMRQFLIKNNIKYKQEQSFDWLRYKKKLFLDFYLPDYNIAIECQGGQHFKPIDLFGGEEFYQKTLERDMVKQKLCKDHGIRIIYFSNVHINYPYSVIETFNELLKEINKV